MDGQKEQEIGRIYDALSVDADVLYEFVMRYNEYMHRPRDYGNGDMIKMVEAHTLAMIDSNPGVSVSELARLWKRTKGTVSVNVSTLESRGYVRREKDPQNARVVKLYLTERGRALNLLHKQYDNSEIAKTRAELLDHCSKEELAAFYRVAGLYLGLLQRED